MRVYHCHYDASWSTDSGYRKDLLRPKPDMARHQDASNWTLSAAKRRTEVSHLKNEGMLTGWQWNNRTGSAGIWGVKLMEQTVSRATKTAYLSFLTRTPAAACWCYAVFVTGVVDAVKKRNESFFFIDTALRTDQRWSVISRTKITRITCFILRTKHVMLLGGSMISRRPWSARRFIKGIIF